MMYNGKIRRCRDVMVSSEEIDTTTRVQILDEAGCISQSANTLGKGINLTILTPATGK